LLTDEDKKTRSSRALDAVALVRQSGIGRSVTTSHREGSFSILHPQALRETPQTGGMFALLFGAAPSKA
jgi:hypothetical protein